MKHLTLYLNNKEMPESGSQAREEATIPLAYCRSVGKAAPSSLPRSATAKERATPPPPPRPRLLTAAAAFGETNE